MIHDLEHIAAANDDLGKAGPDDRILVSPWGSFNLDRIRSAAATADRHSIRYKVNPVILRGAVRPTELATKNRSESALTLGFSFCGAP